MKKWESYFVIDKLIDTAKTTLSKIIHLVAMRIWMKTTKWERRRLPPLSEGTTFCEIVETMEGSVQI